MILQAWLDGSGKKNDPVFALSGFLSSVDRWAQFSDEWRRVLDGPPRLEYFKMSEADSRVKQFAGWSERDIQERISDLVEVIRSHVMARVNCWMLRRDYETYRKGKVFPQIDDPYFYCFHSAYMTVRSFLGEQGIDAEIEFYFDEEGGLGKHTAAWYPVVRHIVKVVHPEDLKYFGGKPHFRDDKKFLPLQAADLYAFDCRWAGRSKASGLITPPSRIERALQGVPSLNVQQPIGGLRKFRMGPETEELAGRLLKDILSAMRFTKKRKGRKRTP